MSRRTLLTIHFWIAITLCIPMVVLGLTGSALVFQTEIDAAIAPLPAHVRFTEPTHGRDAIIVAARGAVPAGTRVRSYAPPGSDDIAVMQFSARGNPRLGTTEVAIDARSLRILRARNTADSPFRVLHRLHENLTLGAGGRIVVGLLGIAMLMLGGSGLAMWFGRNVTRMRAGVGGFSLYRDFHTALGFWSLIAFVAVSGTGVCLAFPQVFPHGPLASIRPVHTGALGLPWKIVVFLVGLLPLTFAVSGIAMRRSRGRAI